MARPNAKRVPLYDRLPQIYHVRDAEQSPPGQLQHYLATVEVVFGDIHANIEALYHDFFIDTCDEWVIPYIGDLLGVSPLKGEARTLRADVADTVALRRRKGTLGAIERLTYNLTGWGVHGVELRENLLWNQHLNHQRPDAGGAPPYGLPSPPSPTPNRFTPNRFTPIWGGTVTLRDPAMLSLVNTPFDPFGHTADVKPPALDAIRYNLPNLAIFLWRLKDYRVAVSPPVIRDVIDNSAAGTGASFIVRADVHPLGIPVRLFNTARYDPDLVPPIVSRLDETPGPMPPARLTEASQAGSPEQYVLVEPYDPASLANPDLDTLERLDIGDVGLQLHLPEPEFANRPWPRTDPPSPWTLRGENLCAWETGLARPFENNEIAVDPVIGRLIIGVETAAEAEALRTGLLLTYTYGAVGPVGAHPVSRENLPKTWQGETVEVRPVNFHVDPTGLQTALNDIQDSEVPIAIEIRDSMVHELDLGAIASPLIESGGPNLRLGRSLILRAASGQRPIIRLAQPLRFRPTEVFDADPDTQNQLNGLMDRLTVRLEGLYLTRGAGFPAGEPLIARAALNSLELVSCTLEPGGFQQLDGDRAPIQPALWLENDYGFADANELTAFDQTPEIHLSRTVSGPLAIDTGYTLFLTESLLDAGKGVGDDPADSFAVAGFGPMPEEGWGPPTVVNGLTVLGRMRVREIRGKGGIWVHALEVLNNQKGCLKYSYFSGQGDRLPQHHACVFGSDARLRFTSEVFGQPGYGQLARTSDFRIRDRGPGDDAMGAFGFLLDAHKWRNLQIRYREFMPVGVRPLLIPVT
ncbi:phage tail protein [Nodosilinea nodulosa]|uniref:phage tail protein n=1 Tax=Nodosilinea nodulosa TaxID=416001 RepID=UPI00031CEB80|nr:phage tail protein [Nodosilinea nodulosa]